MDNYCTTRPFMSALFVRHLPSELVIFQLDCRRIILILFFATPTMYMLRCPPMPRTRSQPRKPCTTPISPMERIVVSRMLQPGCDLVLGAGDDRQPTLYDDKERNNK